MSSSSILLLTLGILLFLLYKQGDHNVQRLNSSNKRPSNLSLAEVECGTGLILLPIVSVSFQYHLIVPACHSPTLLSRNKLDLLISLAFGCPFFLSLTIYKECQQLQEQIGRQWHSSTCVYNDTCHHQLCD